MPAPQLTATRIGSAEGIAGAGGLLGRARGCFRAGRIEVDVLAFQRGPSVIASLGTDQDCGPSPRRAGG